MPLSEADSGIFQIHMVKSAGICYNKTQILVNFYEMNGNESYEW